MVYSALYRPRNGEISKINRILLVKLTGFGIRNGYSRFVKNMLQYEE